jgi:hypothetical protein
MPGLRLRVFLSGALAVIVGAAAAAAAVKQATFQCEYTLRTPTYGVVESATLTTKGRMVRYQKRTGAGLKLLFIRNHQGTYHINMHTNDGARWPLVWEKDLDNRLATPGPQGDPMIFLKAAHATRTGRKKVDGHSVEVWTYGLPTTSGKPQEVTVYLEPKTKRPLKAVTRLWIGAGRVDAFTIEYKTYRWDFPLPDSYFDLPKGAKVADLRKVEPSLLNPPETFKARFNKKK